MTTPTTALTYNGYVTQIATLAVVNVETVSGVVVGANDDAFDAIIPQMLNYAELRIQRDVDLLPLQTSRPYTFTNGSNIFQVSVDDFVTIQTIETATGPLLPVTKEFLQNVYGTISGASTPLYFAPYGGDVATAGNTYNRFVLGPWPDSNYPVTVTGTIRMPSLYKNATTALAATETTFISKYLPDLLIMASMIFISGYQRNFGRESDDPAMAQSYETQYQALLKGVVVEEYRKKFEASAWSSMSSPPLATPSR